MVQPPNARDAVPWGTGSTGAIFSHCSSGSSDISLALSCLLVMAYYPAKGEPNSREVMQPLL